MSDFKKTIRKEFRLAVFERDSYKCRGCGKQGYDHNDPQEVARQEASGAFLAGLDAHHITSRDEMVAGGYVVENGISLCPECHMKAESPHTSNVEFLPENLYKSIGSSRNNAHMACLALQAKIQRFEPKPQPKKRKAKVAKTRKTKVTKTKAKK
tara:strand:- start:46935 stop:47396 length:462 start_codon:yes stop_codon:yes gene_type:complete